MDLLLISFSAIVYLLNILYLHAFAALKTVGLLYKFNELNKGKDEVEVKEIIYMLVYWIVFVCTSFLQHCWGLSTLRVLFLTAVLSTQFNLKKKIYEELFTGDHPKFE
jgi:hypothetical protein